MKTLLLAESDKSTRDELVGALAELTDEMRVLAAGDGEEAARVLASLPVDILVTDLVMPAMDGFELLNYVLAEHPGIEIVAMGETELGRTSQALCRGGVCRFLSKPVDADDLTGAVRDILARPAKGRLTGLSLPGFLQLLSAEGRTCCLRVTALGHEGFLDINRGQLVNASCDGTEGKAAFFEALGWVNPEIEVEEPRVSTPRLIDERLPSLLLEAALQQDARVSAVLSGTPSRHAASTDSPVTIRSGEATSADLGPEPDSGAGMRAFSSFAAVPMQLEVVAAAKGLRRFMQLDGTLGAGIFEFDTGRSLAHVCRGRSRYFAEIAADAARVVRDEMQQIEDDAFRRSVRQLRLCGSKQFQLLRVVHSEPRLLLVFMGLSGRTDIGAASNLLADFEETILASSGASIARTDGPG